MSSIDKDQVEERLTTGILGQWYAVAKSVQVKRDKPQAVMSTFADTTDDAWHEELELKFFSQIYPVRAFKPLLDKSDSAAILAVNSLLAYQPEPYMKWNPSGHRCRHHYWAHDYRQHSSDE